MIDKSIEGNNFNPDNFKDYILKIERANLRNINKENKQQMVDKIIRTFEEAKKDADK